MPTDPMDPANPVTALCIEGMEAEGRGDYEAARRLFEEAWAIHRTPLEAAVAAHYVARHQATPEQTLEWNRRALSEARAADPASVAGLLPSLHLNLGKGYEDAGDSAGARRQYLLAEQASSALPHDGYGQFVRGGITRALERTESFDSG